MRDGFAYITSNIMYQAPWDPINFDKYALKSDLNQIPEITVTQLDVVNRSYLAYWKEAEVWFTVLDDNISEEDLEQKMLEAVKSGNRAREAIREFEIGTIPEGTYPAGVFEGGNVPWVAIGSTALTIATILLVIDYIRG